jgi:hypothetical protein
MEGVAGSIPAPPTTRATQVLAFRRVAPKPLGHQDIDFISDLVTASSAGRACPSKWFRQLRDAPRRTVETATSEKVQRSKTHQMLCRRHLTPAHGRGRNMFQPSRQCCRIPGIPVTDSVPHADPKSRETDCCDPRNGDRSRVLADGCQQPRGRPRSTGREAA